MYKNNDINHRYERAIKCLNNNIEIELFPKDSSEAIADVHKFDNFYADFFNILEEIKLEYAGAEIFLNASSGTPAMKSTMTILSVISANSKLKLIQVASPNKSSNAKIRSYLCK
jgi:putative lipase involved disintegration of autophagic bodies